MCSTAGGTYHHSKFSQIEQDTVRQRCSKYVLYQKLIARVSIIIILMSDMLSDSTGHNLCQIRECRDNDRTDLAPHP